MKIDLINTIQREFKNKPSFTKEELVNILTNFFKNEKTITWRIHDLKAKGIINHLQRGVYSLGGKKQYIPDVSEKAKAIYQWVQQNVHYVAFEYFLQLRAYWYFLIFRSYSHAL